MKATIIVFFACFYPLKFDVTVAFTALPPTPLNLCESLVRTIAADTITKSIIISNSSSSHGELQMKANAWQRVFRRGGKQRVQTLEREPASTKTSKKTKDPEKIMWRVMFHNSEYQPHRVALVLSSIFPFLDRGAAFEICTRARSVGKVAVFITSKKEAEMYCLALNRQGLTATIEPHDVEV